MSKMKKPKSEFTQLESRHLFKAFSQTIFKDFSCDELNKLSDSGLSLKFSKSTPIAKRNEQIQWFGILLQGEILLSIGQDTLGTIHPGSLIGSLAVLEYKPSICHIFDLTGNSEGILSCFLLEDLANVHRKFPKCALKFIELLGKQTLSSVSYNFHQKTLFSINSLKDHEYSTRRKQEFIAAHPLLNKSDLDRVDIKRLASVFKVIHFKEGTWITKIGLVENSVFFVIEGRCGNFESREFEDDVFGAENFLVPGTLWKNSVVGAEEGIILWMRLEDFTDVVTKYSFTCGKFIKILTNYEARKIFDRKTHRLPIIVKTDQDFIELDPTQLSDKSKLNLISEESDEDDPKQFPLYTFPMYEEAVRVKDETERPASPESIFPKERLNKQMVELKSKKRKTEKSVSPRGKREIKKKEISTEITEIVKEIVADIKITEEANCKLLEEIQKLHEENREFEKIITEEGLDIESREVRLKKTRVLKDIEKLKNAKDININLAPSFQKITTDQIKLSKEFYLAWKYSEKWKAFITRKRQQNLAKMNTFNF